MISLLIDANLDGHARLLRNRLFSADWSSISQGLGVELLFLEDVGLDRHSPDNVVWQVCQDHGYWLLTANRNQEKADSLEAMIRTASNFDSIPVLTLADANRMLQGGDYLDRVVERLLDILMRKAQFLGTGRLFLP